MDVYSQKGQMLLYVNDTSVSNHDTSVSNQIRPFSVV